jgi:hypothetical protein
LHFILFYLFLTKKGIVSLRHVLKEKKRRNKEKLYGGGTGREESVDGERKERHNEKDKIEEVKL